MRKLLIEVNPYSLEGARRRVLVFLPRADGRTHDIGKLPCGDNRPSLPSSNNRLCNLFSKPFFTIIADHLPDLGFTGCVQPLCGGLPPARVHAHVERAVAAKTEATRGIVELRRGHAQVQQHSIHTLQAEAIEHSGQFGEARVHHIEASIAYSFCSRDRFRIAVERDQAPARIQPAEDQAAVSAAAKGCIDVGTIGTYCQSIDRLLQQYRPVRVLRRHSARVLSPKGGHRAKSSIPGGSWVCAASCRNCFSHVSWFQISKWLPCPTSITGFSRVANLRNSGEISTRDAASISTSSAKPTSRRFHTEKRASSAGKPMTRARIGSHALAGYSSRQQSGCAVSTRRGGDEFSS